MNIQELADPKNQGAVEKTIAGAMGDNANLSAFTVSGKPLEVGKLAGATAVLIANDTPGEGAVSMGGADATVTVPVLSPRGWARVESDGRFRVPARPGDTITVETRPPRVIVVPDGSPAAATLRDA